MNGREEMEIKIEKQIDELLKDAPEIVKDFRYELSSKTALTKKEYIKHVLEFISFIEKNGKDIYSLRKTDINKYVEHIKIKNNGQKASVSTVRTKISSVKCFYNYLLDDELIEKDPTERIKAPTEINEKDVVFMTVDEVLQMKRNIMESNSSPSMKARDYAFVTLGCQTGLRCSAINNINVSDVNFDRMTISVVEKGNKIRDVKMSTTTAEAIRNWLEYRKEEMIKARKPTDALFIMARGKRMTADSSRAVMKKCTKNIDKHITPHKMRSTCATNVYDASDGDIYLTMEVLGHKNIANTRRYVRVSEQKVVDIAEKIGKLY